MLGCVSCVVFRVRGQSVVLVVTSSLFVVCSVIRGSLAFTVVCLGGNNGHLEAVALLGTLRFAGTAGLEMQLGCPPALSLHAWLHAVRRALCLGVNWDKVEVDDLIRRLRGLLATLRLKGGAR